ncbi:4'-phosphopantetheinyl transferase family protein [Achromobacter xylosoxidans]|uniref:4'-phosphopantetheinyl transferase family protein n=1 Tax=Alcaligenes xylosoxydans xylosoxydans TaxID=85698 RepID=UPI001F064ECA|nr:4'-phosphopantetheinyl transferase superfamily protein [Achromobacter xylosoxidans]MCH1985170.1 4'-phosphopantetheinyl transferase superfamily protein [Achromobacter xylosoxidans]MCH4586066.1 4'-phosphopantetheinyl transferase superfamily protein [Achromobacter xylosoxidans]
MTGDSTEALPSLPLSARLAQRLEWITPGASAAGGLPPTQRRQAEFQAGRRLAAALLAALRAPATDVGVAADRSPIWPAGYVGSISHSRRLVGVAVARHSDVRAVGIDIEAIADPSAVEAIESLCMRPEERAFDAGALTRAEFATLLFSAKEAFYKCMQPLTQVAFDFADVSVTRIDPARQCLELRLLRAATAEFGPGRLFQCGYRSAQGHVYTALEIGH